MTDQSLGSVRLCVESKLMLLRNLVAAIEGDDYEDFCEQTEMGAKYFGEEEVVALLAYKLPLMLGEELYKRQIMMMVRGVEEQEGIRR